MMIEGNEPIDKIAKYTGYGIDRIKENCRTDENTCISIRNLIGQFKKL